MPFCKFINNLFFVGSEHGIILFVWDMVPEFNNNLKFKEISIDIMNKPSKKSNPETNNCKISRPDEKSDCDR
jgi:hypothetical protein